MTHIMAVCASVLLFAVPATESDDVRIDSGTVFINGKIIEPPYVVEQRDDMLLVNGHALVAVPNLPDGRQMIQNSPECHVATVERFLLEDGWIFAFDTNRTAWFGSSSDGSGIGAWEDAIEFLSLLTSKDVDHQSRIHKLLALCVPGLEHLGTRDWQEVVKGFNPTPELIEFINESGLTTEDSSGTEYAPSELGDSQLATKISPMKSGSVRYAMSICGMMLSVVAFGYLIQYRPSTEQGLKEQNAQRPAVQAVYVCLTFIVLMGIFDLASTLSAGESSNFTEVNPLGSLLLKSPIMATAFKMIATGVGVSLLFRFRVYIFAQLASWWMCLVSTLVVFRWVIFRAMLID